jgi:flagellar hook assembly protein FlgD
VIDEIINPNSFRVFPNPVSDRAFLEILLEEPGKVVIEIIEGRGKIVSKQSVYHMGSGAEIFEWDLKDASGNGVNSGLYYCRIVSDKGISVSKIMVQH